MDIRQGVGAPGVDLMAEKQESSLNVTPMADVSLSLLLGFLVITPIILETLSTKLP